MENTALHVDQKKKKILNLDLIKHLIPTTNLHEIQETKMLNEPQRCNKQKTENLENSKEKNTVFSRKF